MANTAQARKRARQNIKRRQHNVALRSAMRTAMKRVIALIGNKDTKALPEAYRHNNSVLDKAVSKGLVHKNKAARHKRRLNAHIKQLTVGAPSPAQQKQTTAKTATKPKGLLKRALSREQSAQTSS